MKNLIKIAVILTSLLSTAASAAQAVCSANTYDADHDLTAAIKAKDLSAVKVKASCPAISFESQYFVTRGEIIGPHLDTAILEGTPEIAYYIANLPRVNVNTKIIGPTGSEISNSVLMDATFMYSRSDRRAGMKVIDAILDRGADIGFHTTLEYDALSTAVGEAWFDVVKKLVARGADINRTYYHINDQKILSFVASDKLDSSYVERVEILNYLLALPNIDLNHVGAAASYSPIATDFCRALQTNSSEFSISRILIQNSRFPVNRPFWCNGVSRPVQDPPNTLLAMAVTFNHLGLADTLLSRADIDTKSDKFLLERASTKEMHDLLVTHGVK